MVRFLKIRYFFCYFFRNRIAKILPQSSAWDGAMTEFQERSFVKSQVLECLFLVLQIRQICHLKSTHCS